MARLPYATLAPEANKHLMALSGWLEKSELGESLLDLVYLRVSQINGCPYCVDLHWREACERGVEMRKLNAVVVWNDAPFFTDREKAAFAWAEAVTNLRDRQVPDGAFEHAKQHFTDKELADLTFAIAAINAWNRIAIAFHVVPVE